MKNFARNLGAIGLLAGTLTGCGGAYVAYSGPPAPPPPRASGYVGVAPGPGYVWVDGYYDWGGRSYVWVPGRWLRPPRPRAVWVPGRFVQHGRGHQWVRGHWRY